MKKLAKEVFDKISKIKEYKKMTQDIIDELEGSEINSNDIRYDLRALIAKTFFEDLNDLVFDDISEMLKEIEENEDQEVSEQKWLEQQ